MTLIFAIFFYFCSIAYTSVKYIALGRFRLHLYIFRTDNWPECSKTSCIYKKVRFFYYIFGAAKLQLSLTLSVYGFRGLSEVLSSRIATVWDMFPIGA